MKGVMRFIGGNMCFWYHRRLYHQNSPYMHVKVKNKRLIVRNKWLLIGNHSRNSSRLVLKMALYNEIPQISLSQDFPEYVTPWSGFTRRLSEAIGPGTLTYSRNLTLMLLVANFANTNQCKKSLKMTELLTHGYSSESAQRELSN